MSEFNYKSTISDIQSRLISQSIRDSSNLDFAKSEESMLEVIKSYQDRFKSVAGMMLDVSRYVAQSTKLIRVEDFNELFESVYIDLSALYYDLDLVDKVLKLNLGRNKNYFLVIKKRIRDLWNKLNLTRTLVYDDNPSDESFYESFYTKTNAKSLSNISIDKKVGLLHLASEYSRTHTLSSIIKKVTSVTYPEHSDNGGVRFTSSVLNSFNDNYTSGPRDMLENGLWKEQVICNDIPEIIVNIGSHINPIRKLYKGIVSLVDIEYVYPVEINRIDLDVFGDMTTSIDAILYKTTSSSDWEEPCYYAPRYRTDIEDISNEYTDYIKGEAFDVISFFNINKISAKHLRIVFNQKNYIFLDSKDIKNKTVDEKIQDDLSERRYELIKFGSDLEDLVSKPTNDDNSSLYFKIIEIIESTRNVEKLLNEIDELINPKIIPVSYDFERTAKFELGAWSIEPRKEKYTKGIGKFDSMPYSIQNKSLLSASLVTSQSLPKSSSISWYISVGGKNIPIIENDNRIRREPANPIDMRKYLNFSTWDSGTFFLLDLPLDPEFSELIYISCNGNGFRPILDYGKVAYLNSRLIFIQGIKNPFEAIYTFQYVPAVKSAINLYGIVPISPGNDTPDEVALDIVSSRYEVLKTYMDNASLYSDRGTDNINLSYRYNIVSVGSTLGEAAGWFGNNFNSCLFVGQTLMNSIIFESSYIPDHMSTLINRGYSKSSSTKTHFLQYISGNVSDFADLNLIGTLPNISPLSQARSI